MVGRPVVGPPSFVPSFVPARCRGGPARRHRPVRHRADPPATVAPTRCDTGPIYQCQDATAVHGVCCEYVNTLWTVGIRGSGAPPRRPTADLLCPERRTSRWPGACRPPWSPV